MELKVLPYELTICQLSSDQDLDIHKEFFFLSRTDEELSLVCLTAEIPQNTVSREDGWRCLRIEGILDFSLIGILAKLSGILAEHQIGIFVVSTYNTDYILVKDTQLEKALIALKDAGYHIVA